LSQIRSTTRQLTGISGQINWDKATFVWSPDGSQIMAIIGLPNEPIAAYLLASDRFTAVSQLRNTVIQLPITLEKWQQQWTELSGLSLTKLPEELQKIATQSAKMVAFSPDEKKFFYAATSDGVIKDNLLPHPPARSTQKEERTLTPGKVYVYDLEDDTNFALLDLSKVAAPTPTPTGKPGRNSKGTQAVNKTALLVEQYREKVSLPIHWLADSKHLVFIEDSQVKVIEIDGTNKQTVFSGPFLNGFIFPSADGTRLVVLTSLHADLPPNLYGVKIR